MSSKDYKLLNMLERSNQLYHHKTGSPWHNVHSTAQHSYEEKFNWQRTGTSIYWKAIL